ncbi:OmpH family outer membrane protein [Sphingobium sp. CFD-2]|jgi:Skp family chaperone for outer membrane proteins|uniref:OmpH family outer membrane protein n=1 Tax=Sphingobium sp. CFD-2 TaxID=2878542 RepID=UPI00214D0864|nr:OmpH family outer membrane protein [Sphingobium sp. CFD-2]TNE30056.1 MAG: OmpH family outer membrane protein [Alphaproteobacteria bacterium]TNF05231.1 MAG: OmpH family outer membrane protein [Sphingomonadales bacterium]
MSRFSIFLAILAAGAAPVSLAAQTASPAPGLGGPVIPGVCLLSREAIFANAAVAKAATTRLAELARTAQSEIDQQRTPLETEVKSLEGQPDNAQTKQKRDALATRWTALQRKAAHNSREIEATRAKAMERILTEVQPVISQAYTNKKCGLLLDRSVTLGGNFANDLTADVLKGLDAKIQTITFERERLPEQQP